MTPSRDGLSRLSCEIISSANPRVARCVVVLNPISRHHSDSRRDGARRFLNHGLGRSLGTVPTPHPAPDPLLPQRTRKLSPGRA
jgi:hypothetical protein